MCFIQRFGITTLFVVMILCGQLFASNAPVTTDLSSSGFWVYPLGGYDWPTWVRHGEQLDVPISFINYSGPDILFTVTPEEETAPSGWLALPPELQGTILLLPGTDIQSTIGMNVGGIVNAPGTIVYLKGQLVIEIEGDPLSYNFPVECWVADTLFMPSYDTVTTGCFSLVISNNGNFGNQGEGHVNLDYFDYGDCDNLEGTEDTIPGKSTVYLYDGSPVICWTDEFDTVRCNWSIFGQDMNSDNGFIPIGDIDSGTFFQYNWSNSPPDSLYVCKKYTSQFVTHDSGILIEKTWYIPHVPDYQANDGSNFIVQSLSISSADGQMHTGLNIGEIVDWDIPSDSGSRNLSGFDATNRLIWQQGSEYNDDPQECQENNDRFGGIRLLRMLDCWDASETVTDEFYGAWTGSNSLWVYPAGGFVPSELDSLMTAREGFVRSDSTNADLHSVMTFKSDYTLTPDNNLIVFSCLITTRLGYAAFITAASECNDFYSHYMTSPQAGCCIESTAPLGRGNVDYSWDDLIDISDLVYLVDYMFTGGSEPPCWPEANVDGVGPDDFTGIDISDLVYLVDYMFTGGPPPPPCP